MDIIPITASTIISTKIYIDTQIKNETSKQNGILI